MRQGNYNLLAIIIILQARNLKFFGIMKKVLTFPDGKIAVVENLDIEVKKQRPVKSEELRGWTADEITELEKKPQNYKKLKKMK